MATTKRTALTPVTYEALAWEGRVPYQAAVPADVADVNTVLQAQTMAMAAEAAAEVTRFDAELGGRSRRSRPSCSGPSLLRARRSRI